jgi:hypothetical protein
VRSLVMCLTVTVAASSVPSAAQVNVKSQIYAAIMSEAVYHGVRGAELLVKDVSIPIPVVRSSAVAEWLDEFNALPAELREGVRRAATSKSGPVDRSLFPAGTRFISAAAIAEVFTQQPFDSWVAFRYQYKTAGWVSFSDVMITSDALDALVYAEARCGKLCGEGVYIWLHRARPAAPWSILKGVTKWIA